MVRKQAIGMVCLCIFFLLFPDRVKAFRGEWYEKYTAFENEKGNAYFRSYDSSTLGWGESYLLRSYIEVYKKSGETKWLDKFTNHIDTMLSNSRDDDQDGYLGWTTHVYSPNIIGNGGFEMDLEQKQADANYWRRYQSNSLTAFKNKSPAVYNGKVYGRYGVVLKSNGKSWQKLYQKIGNYAPNTKYFFNFFGKTNGAVNGEAYIYDKTDRRILSKITINNKEWTYYRLFVTMPDAGHDLEIWLGHEKYNINKALLYVDEVRLNASLPYLAHDAMVGIPMAEFVRLVGERPELQTAYKQKADKYLAFLTGDMIPKWEKSYFIGNTWDPVLGLYRDSPNFPSYEKLSSKPGAVLPYNMSLAYAQLLADVYSITKNQLYLNRAMSIHLQFKTKLEYVPKSNAYIWRYRPDNNGLEDTSHGQIDISSVLEMHRQGLLYTREDMRRFANTFSKLMVDPSVKPYQVANYVSGRNTPVGFIYTKTLLNWIELAEFDPSISGVTAGQFRNYTPTTANDFLTLSQLMKWE